MCVKEKFDFHRAALRLICEENDFVRDRHFHQTIHCEPSLRPSSRHSAGTIPALKICPETPVIEFELRAINERI